MRFLKALGLTADKYLLSEDESISLTAIMALVYVGVKIFDLWPLSAEDITQLITIISQGGLIIGARGALKKK